MTNTELQNIYFGAYSFDENDGYLMSYQYTKEQIAYFKEAFQFWYERCSASTAKTLEFTTEARNISFDYKFFWKGSEDSFELCVDGLITDIRYVKDIPEEGTIKFELPEGSKDVIIYLPADATAGIKNFEADASVMPADKNEKVLWLGDSITQGYGPDRSAETYVSVANRLLNYDIINQGIGGYIYDKKSLMKMEGYSPDKIIVALGTNQFWTEDGRKVVEEYYEALTGLYGNDIPILCISPIWRGDIPDARPKFTEFCNTVKEIAGRYRNVTVVDGFKLVPHLPEYYKDNLHPNCLGAETYGRNLVEVIRKIGF
ncbi:MAG: SGNH/GDSL hydrolase family protein [Lachnospiraceae bacterium]|nr:SGNH/GDSL hydrolase family protein [Lachnospiraceae bacterium]